MFRIGSKVRCTLKGEQGGVVLWSGRNTTGILVGDQEIAYDNHVLESMEDYATKFQRGQLVRHIHRGSIRGYVFQYGKEKTTIMMGTKRGKSLSVFYTDQLEPAKAKKPKNRKSRKGSRENSSILNGTLDTDLQLPAIFVDATMGVHERSPRAVAVLVGHYGEQLYHAMESAICDSSGHAEIIAVELGIDIRMNDNWPIYTDAQGLEKRFAGQNVKWVPRTQNRIADQLLRVYA